MSSFLDGLVDFLNNMAELANDAQGEFFETTKPLLDGSIAASHDIAAKLVQSDLLKPAESVVKATEGQTTATVPLTDSLVKTTEIIKAAVQINLSHLLSPVGVMPSFKAKSKRQALQKLSHTAAQLTGLPAREIFDKMQQRERLGSTGLGRGTAIPHVESRSLKSIVCLFARLDKPIEFDSPDGEPVDLIFLLLAPEHAYGDYLKALARIARLVREPNTLEWLRTSKDGAAIYAVLTEPPHSPASIEAAPAL
jgi:PTS system nitrogen regulatory IIA component